MDNTDRKIKELNALIETNLDAVKFLEDGLEGLQASNLREAVQQMHSDHIQAAQRLQGRVRELGGEPQTTPHVTNSLKESWVEIWEDGSDKSVMLALRANERVAVDGFKVQSLKEDFVRTMTEEGLQEHKRALEMELRHFQTQTDLLRDMGAAVDNDEVTGAVRNAAEHVHAAINLSGAAIEAFIKWATPAPKQ